MIQPGSMSIILPLLERLGRGAGRLLVGVAVSLDLLLVLAGWKVAHLSEGTWLPLIVALILAVPIAIFAWRRHRLAVGVEATRERLVFHTPTSAPSATEVIVRPTADTTEEQRKRSITQERAQRAMRESAKRRDTYWPRIESAQRAAIAMAGGVENAPYLKDDVRVTLISLIATVASIPLSVVFLITALFLIL
ncbi:hypothetical protein [Arcanobacterium canis]